MPSSRCTDFQVRRSTALSRSWRNSLTYPDDPLRTFPTSDPYVRRAEFGGAGLITYLINDGAGTVIILDVTWTG